MNHAAYLHTMKDDPLRISLRGVWSAAASSWETHADFVDDRGKAVAAAMLDAAGLSPGERVLELGCGPGGAGFAAAEIVGADGSVVLSDIAIEMIDIAANRAAARGITNVTTRQLDLEEIDCADASFDATLCREALMLVPDPAAAVAETYRVLRPGGRAVFAVWGSRDANRWLGVLLDVISEQLGMPVPPPGVPGPFSLSDPAVLVGLLSAAGFGDVAVQEVASPMGVSTFEQWWTTVPALAGPVGPLLASLPDDVRLAVKSEAQAALAPFEGPLGYELPGVSLVAAGLRPR
jgi:SAM-dependent methyltransferase